MEKPLAEYACIPCRGGVPPLTPEEYRPLLEQLNHGWKVDDGKLVKSFSFPNFVEAVALVNRITPIAETEGHHPDLYVAWGKVDVYLWTHKINGLSPSDFYLAAKIQRAYEEMTRGAGVAGQGMGVGKEKKAG
ncbi:MAG TPA: 4a-hydroxytetrahydrobiopterin dehydratase [Chloroflexota bacterium]|nr:4a-hydroxytetrahydrobiopterin dehydratase [Chloroflexota bacterium]